MIVRQGVALARAFHDEPLFRYALPDERRRARALPAIFTGTLRHAQRYGGVVGDERAVSSWVPVPRAEIGPADAWRAGLATAPLSLGPAASWRLLRHESVADRRVRDLAEPSWAYIPLVGVDPAHHGTGLGREVVDATIAALAGRYPAVILRTEQSRNVGFYTHLGFGLVEEFTPPTSGVTVWVFVREL